MPTPSVTKRRRVPRSVPENSVKFDEPVKPEPVLPAEEQQPEPVDVQGDVVPDVGGKSKKLTKVMRIEQQRNLLLEIKSELDQLVQEWNVPVDLSTIPAEECTMKDYGRKVLKVVKPKTQKKRLDTITSKLNRALRTSDTLTRKRGGTEQLKQVSSQLAEFAGWETTDLKTRKDVSLVLKNYIDEKGLRVDSKQIRLDSNLRKALDIPDTVPDVINNFRIQAYVPRALKKVVA